MLFHRHWLLGMCSLALALGLWEATSRGAEGPALNEAGKKELAALQGTWQAQSIESKEEKRDVSGDAESRVTFKEHELHDASGKVVARIAALDAEVTPKIVDFIGEDGKTLEAIYELKDDSLTICVHLDGDRRERPAKFEVAGNSARLVIVLKRMAQ